MILNVNINIVTKSEYSDTQSTQVKGLRRYQPMAKPLTNIEKKMSSGGPDTPRLNMKQFIKIADIEKIEADVLEDLTRELQNMYEKEKKSGQSFSDWLKSKPIDELKRIELSNGGTANEKYGDLIDAFEKGIDVLPGESLTDYINRIRKMELQEKMRKN
jgi:hypothetical protein